MDTGSLYMSGPVPPASSKEWFGFIVDSKGVLKFKAKVL
jgi:hypothetical protein